MANGKGNWLGRMLALALAVTAFAALAHATYLNASLVNSSGAIVRDLVLGTTSVLYDASAGAFIDPNPGLNPNLKLRVCASTSGELSSMYATTVYKVGSSQKVNAKDSSSDFAGLNAPVANGTGYCADTNLSWNFVSGYADYPGYIYAVVSSDQSLNASDTFIFIPTTSGWLNGGYTTSDPQSAYNQATGYLANMQASSATGRKSDNTLVEVAGNSNNYIAIGVCNVTGGLLEYSCSDSTLTNKGTNVNLNTGVTYASYGYSDTHRNMHLVVNGIPSEFCMGPSFSLGLAANNTAPNDGEDVKFTATVTNTGNVNVTSSFNVTFFLDSVSSGTKIGTPQSIASLAKGASSAVSATWDTFNKTGSHTIYAVADYEGRIDVCGASGANDTVGVDVAATYFAIVWVDGVQTFNFTNPGEPYNVTVAVKQSIWSGGDWQPVPNATVRIVELNGISEFAPVQAWSESSSKRGLNSYAVAEVATNSSGKATFALIPTGNGTFGQYSGLPLTDYVRNYSIYLEIYVDGEKKPIYYNGASYGDSMPLYLTSQAIPQPDSKKTVVNNGFVEYVMNAAYTIYSRVKGWLTYGT